MLKQRKAPTWSRNSPDGTSWQVAEFAISDPCDGWKAHLFRDGQERVRVIILWQVSNLPGFASLSRHEVGWHGGSCHGDLTRDSYLLVMWHFIWRDILNPRRIWCLSQNLISRQVVTWHYICHDILSPWQVMTVSLYLSWCLKLVTGDDVAFDLSWCLRSTTSYDVSLY